MESKILDIISRNLPRLKEITTYEKRTFNKVLNCRTMKLPGMYYECDHCGKKHPVYKSCKNRMCPLCNNSSSLKWTAKRESELLPVVYFMITYTVPAALRQLFLYNKKTCYNLLFKASSQTIQNYVKSGFRGLKGKAGFYALLHTWDQKINHHPHIHILIPGGCISLDKTKWNSSLPLFFLPVTKLSYDFRELLLKLLEKEKSLKLPPEIDDLQALLNSLKNVSWVVYSKPPKKNSKPEHIIRYLSRYVKKTAVSDKRIIKIEKGIVHLKYYDREKKVSRVEKIPEVLFLERLTLHILPKGFQKVRAYGFMSNRYRRSMITLARLLLGEKIDEQEEPPESLDDIVFLFWKYFKIDIALCEYCQKGHMILVKTRSIRKKDKGG